LATNEATKPKHRQLFEELGQAIQKGAYVPGQRLPTEAELMQQYWGLPYHRYPDAARFGAPGCDPAAAGVGDIR
jgi:hypothetical protein